MRLRNKSTMIVDAASASPAHGGQHSREMLARRVKGEFDEAKTESETAPLRLKMRD
jgi:hypothetical protein